MKNEPTPTVAQIAVVASARIAEAKEVEAEAKAAVKEQEKWAVKRGVNLPALREVVKAVNGDDFQKFIEHHRDCIAYAHAFGKPIEKAQIDFFNLTDTSLPLDESARLKGHAAALEGFETTKNPYPIDGSAGQQWMAGWHDGERLKGIIQAIGTDELIKASEPKPDADAGGEEDQPSDE